MISFKSFSQTDTRILLTDRVAKLVAKDLVAFDGLVLEHNTTRQQITTLNSKILTLQEVIDNLNKQVENRNSIMQQKDLQIENYKNMSDDLQKALRRERTTKKLYKTGSIIGLILIINNFKNK